MTTFQEEQAQENEAKLNVKVGDAWFRLGRSSSEEVTVAKVTKTQLVFSDGTRVMRLSGEVVGDSGFTQSYYRPATPALRETLLQRKLMKEATEGANDAIARLTAEARGLSASQKFRLVELINGFLVSVREENITEACKT